MREIGKLFLHLRPPLLGHNSDATACFSASLSSFGNRSSLVRFSGSRMLTVWPTR
jgi:hypothetical protein